MGKVDFSHLHTFVVLAYGESPYVDTCLRSLLSQDVKSSLLISTHTHSPALMHTASRYGIRVAVHSGRSMADDWNRALGLAQTRLVTLAHQDDIYLPGFAAAAIRASREANDPLILFTDYRELKDSMGGNPPGAVFRTRPMGGSPPGVVIRIKHAMLAPVRLWPGSRLARRASLSFGNPICCPSVTYVKDRMPAALFREGLVSNLDWAAWEALSREEGAFIYIPRPLMYHRIHAGSQTARAVDSQARRREDLYMLRQFWPWKIPELIEKAYGWGGRLYRPASPPRQPEGNSHDKHP